jgi:hypothetical protein
MLSQPGFLRRSALLAALLLTGSAFASIARADADLDLLRDIAAQPSAGQPPASAAARRARPLQPQARRAVKATRAARATTPRLRLTAEQRGSGRVDVLELSAESSPDSALPAIARKSATVSPALLAVRPR